MDILLGTQMISYNNNTGGNIEKIFWKDQHGVVKTDVGDKYTKIITNIRLSNIFLPLFCSLFNAL